MKRLILFIPLVLSASSAFGYGVDTGQSSNQYAPYLPQWGRYGGAYNPGDFAVEWTASTDMQIIEVELGTCTASPIDGDMFILSIREGGKDGIEIAQTSVAVTESHGCRSGGIDPLWMKYVFSSPVSLVRGIMYGFRISRTGGSISTNSYWMNRDVPDGTIAWKFEGSGLGGCGCWVPPTSGGWGEGGAIRFNEYVPFTLAFPLPGLTPYTAEMWSVMDHYNEERFGCHDGTIVTYTGELGAEESGRTNNGVPTYYPETRNPDDFGCSDQSRLYDYKKFSGDEFVVNNNYRISRKDVDQRYISYDGHPGYDYPVASGKKNGPAVPILAAADGVVIRANMGDKTLGEIWIDHGNGLCTMYNHLSESFVDTGDNRFISKTQPIGMSGSTGASYHHLHFSVFICPATNPLRYVDPYGWNPIPDADVTLDPHTEESICLWDTCQ